MTLSGHVAILLLVGLVCFAPLAHGQNGDPPPPAVPNGAAASVPDLVTKESIQMALDRLNADTGMDEAIKARLVDLYTQALDEAARAEQWAQKTAEYEAIIATAPETVADLEAQLSQPLPPVSVEVADDAPLSEVEQQLTQAEAELAAAQSAEASLRQRMAEQQTRRRQAPDLNAAAQGRLDELRAAEAAPAAETPELLAAQTSLQVMRRRALEAELATYVKELASQDLRGQLLTLQHDLAVRSVARQEKVVAAWREVATRWRAARAREAEAAARLAALEAAEASPVVREEAQALAESIQELSAARGELLEKIRLTELEFQQISDQLNRLEQNFESIEEKVTAAGLNNAIGLLLRRYRAELPDADDHAQNVRLRQEMISEAELTRINLREERLALSNIDSVIAEMEQNLPPAIDEQRREELAGVLRGLLRSKRDNLDAVLQDYDTWLDQLLSLDAQERELVNLAEQFQIFIDERILWIRSAPAVGLATLSLILPTARHLAQPQLWAECVETLYADAIAVPAVYVLAALVFLVLVGIRRHLRAWRAAASETAAKAFSTTYTPTFEVLLHCLLLSLTGPILLWFLGWRLSNSLEATDFARSTGLGLLASARWYFTIALGRQVLQPNSLGDSHFDWPVRATRYIRIHLGWFLVVTLLAAFSLSLLNSLEDEAAMISIGRLIYTINMLGLALFLHLLFRSESPVVREWIAVRGSAALQRAQRPIHIAATIAPMFFLVLAGAGYFYTALRLTGRFYMSMALILALILVSRLVLRWLLLTRRRLAMEQARKRRAALKARAAEDGEGDTGPAEETLDLSVVDMQTQRLLRSAIMIFLLVGLWWVWGEELPAINVLNRFELWSIEEAIPLAEVDPATGVAATEIIRTPITLAHLVFAILVAVMTVAATRNLPGLLEISLLQRMNLAPGERYAVTAVTRYLIGIIGIVYAFMAIGVGWSKVQWLVAALGVGLGFGLQEIFGNFISGLILLFERPIRVGDVVTVSGVTGTVSQIRIRATTIRDFDQKELVVPNKEFVVGQVINWTLSDSILRVVIPVGVSYSADPRRTKEILLEIANANPKVLEDPAPMVHFMNFGDSALQFEIRIFIAGLEHLLDVNHEMRSAITERLRTEGIEIAYPQQDIHIRSINGVPGAEALQLGSGGSPIQRE